VPGFRAVPRQLPGNKKSNGRKGILYEGRQLPDELGRYYASEAEYMAGGTYFGPGPVPKGCTRPSRDYPAGAMQLTINGDRITKGLQTLTRKALRVTHPLTSFTLPTTWDRSLSLILTGATATGKTSLAKALLPNALMINHIDRLREYNSMYDGVIFDDMDFHHYPRESHIHLVDTYEERDIHGRNVNDDFPRILLGFLLLTDSLTTSLSWTTRP